MKKALFILLFFGSIVMIPASVLAQEPDLKSYSLGVNAMFLYDLPVNFYDDAVSGRDMQGLKGENTQLDFGFELYAEKMFTPLFGVQLGFRNGGLSGANDVEYYENSFWELKADAKFLLSNLDAKRIGSPWGFFAKPGLAYGQAEAKRYLIEDDVLNNQTDINYWNIRLGGGVQYQFSNSFRAEMEVTYNTVLHDGFDGFNYAKGFDAYLNTSLGIAYTFGPRDKQTMAATNYFGENYLGNIFGAPAPAAEPLAEPSPQDNAIDSALQAQLAASHKRINDMQREIDQQKEALRKMAESKPANTESTAGKKIVLYFDFDSHRLSAEARKNLLENAERLLSAPFTLVAFADKTGPEPYNQQLKKKRAESVRQFLIDVVKVPAENIQTEIGKPDELGPDNDFLNRRVVVQF